jgi:2-polyprenyl-3-methyl-5-hydroxy-6-metoxy-1,4-benzoquinol methylase
MVLRGNEGSRIDRGQGSLLHFDMPVHHHLPKENMIYQRDQYAKGGLGRWYWDYKDKVAFSYILPHHKRIVDLGCGEGITLEKLMKSFPDKVAAGIDLEHENIAICRDRGLMAIYSNAYDLPLGGGSFDACICIDVFEHFASPAAALGEVHRILTPGGRLIIMIPNDRNFFLARLAMGMFREAFYDPGHDRRWKPSEVVNLVEEEGFVVRSQKNLPFLFWQTGLHHLLVADKRAVRSGR